MRDSQMKNIGQIQPAKKPTKDKIDAADQHSSPRSQMSRGEIHASQHVENDNQIAREIVYFHGHSASRYSIRNRSCFQITSKANAKPRSYSTARAFYAGHGLSA